MSLQLNQKMVRDAVQSAANKLPALPNVLVRILQLTEDSNSGSINEIEELIRSDQAISSRLLRIVNSAYFGLGGRVVSVNQAVVILGFQQVRNLVLSTSLLTSFEAGSPQTKEIQVRLWQQAFTAASAAQLMARKLKLPAKDLELAFVGGLLQNIGSLFILSILSKSYATLIYEANQTGTRVVDIENERLGLNHAEVGAEILAKWGLPADLVSLIGRHEDQFDSSSGSIFAVVQLADRIGELVAMGQSYDWDVLKVSPEIETALGLSQGDIESVWNEAQEKMAAALEQFTDDAEQAA